MWWEYQPLWQPRLSCKDDTSPGGRGVWHQQESTSQAQNRHDGSNLNLRKPWFPISTECRNGLDLPPVPRSAGHQAQAVFNGFFNQPAKILPPSALLCWGFAYKKILVALFALLIYINSNFFKPCFPWLISIPEAWAATNTNSMKISMPDPERMNSSWRLLLAPALAAVATRCRGLQLHYPSTQPNHTPLTQDSQSMTP